jgi:lysozyme
MRTLGVDFAHYQRKANFKELWDQGVRFAFFKATEGTTWVDPQYQTFVSEISAEPIPHGAYHFFLPGSSGKLQAEHFTKVAERNSILRPTLDWETLKGTSPKQMADEAIIWIETVHRLWGARVLFYTYPSFIVNLVEQGCMDQLRVIQSLTDLWIASYRDTPWVPSPWNDLDWVLHQFDGSGGLKLSNGVDCDFNWFNGDELLMHRDLTRKKRDENLGQNVTV